MARKFTYDQEKVKELRMKVVESALRVMKDDVSVDKWSQYKKDMVLKMAPRILPTLTEHSGPDGDPIPLLNVLHNNGNKEDSEPNTED